MIASLLLFAPASVCLGFVTPYAVKLRMSSLADTGKTVGRLYALSTVGSIVGTFRRRIFLDSVRRQRADSLYYCGVPDRRLAAARPVLTDQDRDRRFRDLLLSIVASETSTYMLYQSNGLTDIDTEYSRIRVFQTVEPHSGNPIEAIATDPYFIQSAMLLDSDELAFEYSRLLSSRQALRPGFRNATWS